MTLTPHFKAGSLLFLLGFIGVLSLLPVVPQLLMSQAKPLPLPLPVIQLISVAQSTLLLLIMVCIGMTCSQQVGLASPVVFALVTGGNAYQTLKSQIIPALVGGAVGASFIQVSSTLLSPYLPSEFASQASQVSLPWFTRFLYGGITEEILIRLGLMSFITWGLYRLTQHQRTEVNASNYIIAIVLSALVFGLGHLPAAFALSDEVTAYLLAYIVIGNAGFGLVAGYLYWKRGLECAIGAHMTAHLIFILMA
jgi:hypothetical protein